MSFFAPVGLLFFLVLLGSITVFKGIDIHLVHYLFVTVGLFAFHLLFAYLVDVLELWLAFGIAAAVSVLLASLYLDAALGALSTILWGDWQIGALGVVFSTRFACLFQPD